MLFIHLGYRVTNYLKQFISYLNYLSSVIKPVNNNAKFERSSALNFCNLDEIWQKEKYNYELKQNYQTE